MSALAQIQREVAQRKAALRAPPPAGRSSGALDAAVRYSLPVSLGLAVGAIAMRRCGLFAKAAPLVASIGVAIGRRVADEAINAATGAMAPTHGRRM